MDASVSSSSNLDIAGALASIVGANACLSAPADIEPYVTDYRKIYKGRAAAVVFPSTTAQVSRVMAWCHAHDVVVVPQGGNTSLMGGAVPDARGGNVIVLSLARMKQVLAVDVVNDTLTVQAGVTLHVARAAAEEAG